MSAEAFQLYLPPECKAYQRSIFDVIRIFCPQFTWAKEAEGKPYIRVIEGTEGRLMLDYNGTIYPIICPILTPNEQKRALKMALYQICRQQFQAPDSHWGILTGIRPTKVVHRFWDAGASAEEITQRLTKDYLLDAEKAALLLRVTELQRPYLHSAEEAQRLVSIYISIPFCPTKCLYCSFPSFTLPRPQLLADYLHNLEREITAVGALLQEQGYQVETIYIGGGTPTTLSAAQLDHLLAVIWQSLGWQGFREFTVEAGRPDTITAEKLQTLRRWSVGRISINPQTMWEPTLKLIGRQHTVSDILEKYELARQIGFEAINMDLIIGLPQERSEQFQYTLEAIGRLQPENLTVHTLAVKRASRLTIEQQDIQSDASAVEDMHRYLTHWLETQPYTPYYLYRQKQMIAQLENVGYTLKGHESLYNIQMMEERQHILGLGVGSASKYIHPQDWTLDTVNNPKDLLLYNERIDEIIEKKRARLTALTRNFS